MPLDGPCGSPTPWRRVFSARNPQILSKQTLWEHFTTFDHFDYLICVIPNLFTLSLSRPHNSCPSNCSHLCVLRCILPSECGCCILPLITRQIFRSMVHLSNTFDIDPPTDQHTSMDGEDIPGALQGPSTTTRV